MDNEKVFQMDFGKVYGLLLDKAVRKGRTGQSHYCGEAPETIGAFAGQLAGYEASKGAIQLPYSKPLPLELIADIAKWCAANA